MNAKIIRILIPLCPIPPLTGVYHQSSDQFPFICIDFLSYDTSFYNTNSYKKYLLCCTTYKSVFDTPNKVLLLHPKQDKHLIYIKK